MNDVLDDGMIGVEIVKGQLITHPRDLSPADSRRRSKEGRTETFHGLANLHQPSPTCGVNKALREASSMEVLDVANQAASRRLTEGRPRRHLVAKEPPERLGCTNIHLYTEHILKVTAECEQVKRTRCWVHVDKQVDVAVGGVSTSDDTANTRTFDACRFAAAAKIAARKQATRSPNGDRGTKLPAMVTRLFVDETEEPSARTRNSSAVQHWAFGKTCSPPFLCCQIPC